MSESVVEIIQKEIEFQQGEITKKLIESIRGMQEWLANNGLDRSGQASEFIHKSWAGVVDPYINDLIIFVSELPNELNRDYTDEELNEIEKLLQQNYSGLLQMKSTLYKPLDEAASRLKINAGNNSRISIAIDKIRLKTKHKKSPLSDEFIIKSFDLQKEENDKNQTRFLWTCVFTAIATVISIIALLKG